MTVLPQTTLFSLSYFRGLRMEEKSRKVLHSSVNQEWGTPDWLFDGLNKSCRFTLDLCATSDNALLPRYCSNIQSGNLFDSLTQKESQINWENEVFYCNPPYGKKLHDILSLIPSSAKGVFLLPSRTGSKWFQDMMNNAYWVFFIKGRIKFKKAVHPAPFDSVLFAFNIDFEPNISGRKIYLKEV